jgi:hypothetical protein
MAIDFPDSPTLNQEFTVGPVTWIWNGTTWDGINGANLDEILLVSLDEQTETHTLTLLDKGKMIQMNSSSANSLIFPTDSSVDFPIGSQISVVQTGTGQTTISPDTGVVVSGTPGLKLRSQWSGVTIIKNDENSWLAIGDLSE